MSAPSDTSGGMPLFGINWAKYRKTLLGKPAQRGVIAILAFLALWEIGSGWYGWFGYRLPIVGLIPGPTAVVTAWAGLIDSVGYWLSWYQSTLRVFTGFLAAMVFGIPFGLSMAVNRYFHDIFFPPFEILRPIPPLAWVPASLIFWPTQELSIAFVTFLGAFYTIVINVLGGAPSQWHLFSRIILPGTLPSIFTGAAVGMGITWEVVVAAEMISGGGRQEGGGLGFFIWNSYVGGSLEQIVVGMISIGIAGYVSSSIIRKLGYFLMPWRRIF